MDPNSPLVAIPVAVALITVVGLFLRHIATEKEKDRLTWGNHLSQTVAALTELRDEQKRQGEDAREHYRIK